MATPKKISELTQKTTIDSNDLFVIVDSLDNTNKSVKWITLSNNNGRTLVFNLSDFQSNGGLVYPIGTKIYYRDTKNRITGVYKLSDGVTPLSNLPVFIDNYEIIRGLESSKADKITVLGWDGYNYILDTNTFQVSKINQNVANQQLTQLFIVKRPVNVLSLTFNIPTFSSVGEFMQAFYEISPNNYLSNSLVANSVIKTNITSAGRKTVNYSTPLFLDVGAYWYFVWYSGTYNLEFQNGSVVREGLFNNLSYYFVDRLQVVTQSYNGIAPTSLSMGLFNSVLSVGKLLVTASVVSAI